MFAIKLIIAIHYYHTHTNTLFTKWSTSALFLEACVTYMQDPDADEQVTRTITWWKTNQYKHIWMSMIELATLYSFAHGAKSCLKNRNFKLKPDQKTSPNIRRTIEWKWGSCWWRCHGVLMFFLETYKMLGGGSIRFCVTLNIMCPSGMMNLHGRHGSTIIIPLDVHLLE